MLDFEEKLDDKWNTVVDEWRDFKSTTLWITLVTGKSMRTAFANWASSGDLSQRKLDSILFNTKDVQFANLRRCRKHILQTARKKGLIEWDGKAWKLIAKR